MKPVTNAAAYRFAALDRLSHRRKQLVALGKRLGLRGTILLSPEGVNLFLAGADEAVHLMLDHLRADSRLADLEAKLSYSDYVPFRRLLVKIKPEIISFAVPGIHPREQSTTKLAPRMLKQWLDQRQPVTLLDVRNDYEVKLGAFVGARPIGVSHFRHFPTAVDQLPQELKQSPVVLYCTGGIRCEKAGPLLQQKGFEQVYQLDGGILKYFEQCGGAHYEGECFVFDQRVALDDRLEETPTKMCFACQAPLTQHEQASPYYVVGKSCPSCYRTPRETATAAIAQRHAQLAHAVTPLPGSLPQENRRPLKVPQRADGWSAMQLVCDLFPHISPADWRLTIDGGQLQRAGQPIRAEDVVRMGERIEHVEPSVVEPDVATGIRILHEDAMLVVVHKPAPLPMHPCGRFNRNTLIRILDRVYRPQRLRVAHRLDANTTGVVVLSRTRSIAGILQPQFERGEVDKVYLALVHGTPKLDAFECDAPVSDYGQAAGRREVTELGRPARTEFQVLERRSDGKTLLKVRPRTGRTNQIRLHLAHLGWPVCGDRTYGLDTIADAVQTLSPLDPPLCLHAWQIGFRHPLDGKPVRFNAPPPDWSDVTSTPDHQPTVDL